MNQIKTFVSELDIVSKYAFYNLILVFSVIFIYYIYYRLVLKPKTERKIKYLLKKNPSFTSQEALDYLTKSDENPLKKGVVKTSVVYVVIAYLMSIIAFPLSFYLYECYLLSVNQFYTPITEAKELEVIEGFVLVIFDAVLCLFILLFIFGALANLFNRNNKNSQKSKI